jgi:hypothetical protein
MKDVCSYRVILSAENRSYKVILPIIRIATAACIFPDQINDRHTECDGDRPKIQHSQSGSSISVKCSLQTSYQLTVAESSIIYKIISMFQRMNIRTEFALFFIFS